MKYIIIHDLDNDIHLIMLDSISHITCDDNFTTIYLKYNDNYFTTDTTFNDIMKQIDEINNETI